MKFQKLALVVEQAHIVVSLWTFGLKGWTITRSEKVALPTADPLAEQLLAAIRPLILKWKIVPDTPVLIVAPAGIGGFLSFTLPATQGKDLDVLIDQEIGKVLPFSVREVEKSYRLVKEKEQARISVLWMPRLWVGEMKNALARIGLRVSEVFHRAQLVGRELGEEVANAPWGCIEQDGKFLHFHFFRQGDMVERSRSLGGVEGERLAQELNLDLLSLACIGLSPHRVFLAGVDGSVGNALALGNEAKNLLKPHARGQSLPELLLALWKKDGGGVWLVPDRSAMMARLTPWIIGLVALFAVMAGLLWWTVLDQREVSEQLEADVKKIKQKFQKASAVETEVIRTQLEINLIETATQPGEPLAALYEVFKALPDDAWMVAFRFDGKTLAAEGYGLDDAALLAILKKSPRLTAIEAVPAQTALDSEQKPFSVKMQWKAPPPVATKK